jgi:plastocyanin
MAVEHKPEKASKTTHKQSKKDSQVKAVILLLLLLLVVVIALALHSSSSNKPANNQNGGGSTVSSGKSGKLYLKPASASAHIGNSVTFEVWVDSGSQAVNAVQANLTYSSDKFDFNSIDSKGSAFEVQAMSTGGDGKISIARGHIGDLTGHVLVAKVVLVAKAKGGANISFAQGSALVTSKSHTDILSDKTGSTYTIN